MSGNFFSRILNFLVLYFCLTIIISAQNPSYFVLGKNKLKNAEIYSVLQTKNHKLFVATNEGLYQYIYGEMKEVSSAKGQKGTSFFNLIANDKNEVFCYNLNGQIFKIINHKLELFSQIPSKYLGHQIRMEFDDFNNLIVASNGCISITKNGFKEVYYSETNQTYRLNKLPDNRIVLLRKIPDSLIILSNNKLSFIKNPIINKTEYRPQFTLLDKKIIDLNNIDSEINTTNRFNNYKYFSNKEIWRRSSIGGVEKLMPYDGQYKVSHSFFKDVFISEIAQGNDGVMFFGTFGLGLFVVPSQDTKTHIMDDLGSNLQSIVVDKNENIFISDKLNGIIHFKKEFKKIDENLSKIPEKIFIVSKESSSLSKKYKGIFYNKNLFSGALKNVFEIDSSTVLLSTSIGLSRKGNSFILNKKAWNSSPKKEETKNNITYFKGINTRCQDAVYNKKDSILYVATLSSLLQFESDLTQTEIKYNNQPIIVNDFIFHKDELWCATQRFGILVYKNNELVKQINDTNGLMSNFVNKIELVDFKLFISHKQGFQILDLISNKWKTIGTAEGVPNGSIKDFTIGKKNIWFVSNNKLLSIPLDNLEKKLPTFNFSLDSLSVSNKNFTLFENGNYDHTQNQFKFYVNFSSVLCESEAQITYQLKGFDNQLQSMTFTENLIDYKYLPPGDYNFELQAKFRDYSSNIINYSFMINKPYWQIWWFYVLISVLSFCVIRFIFLYRINKVKAKNIEHSKQLVLKANLIESELKALRSQMNPHFIFNSLNSIQDLILQEDTEASYDYIVLFSNLVRNALNYSNQSFIPIENEIEFLQNYLKLEKLRFGSNFNYSIKYNKTTSFKVPSLIIQPFVENALIHGLFHKHSNKKLSIDFILKDDFLECVITDNGIGRQKSQEIQKRQGNNHKSFALESIKKRLLILREQYSTNIGYEIIDLHENNSPKGTKVVLKLPYLN